MIINPDPAITEGNAAIDKIRQLRAAITNTLNAHQSPSLKFHLVGPLLIDLALQDILETDLQLFCLLSALFVILMILALFKRWEPVALASLIALLALMWSLGILSLSIVIAGGFFVMAPSRFAPTSYFGLLSGLTVIIAVWGDLILPPALISVFRNFAAPPNRPKRQNHLRQND